MNQQEQERIQNARSALYPAPGERECLVCGHAARLHDDPYGCQYEPGDGIGYSAHGVEVTCAEPPCGCKALATADEPHASDCAVWSAEPCDCSFRHV